MSKREFPYKCPNKGCTKSFKQDGMNDHNLKIHQDKCQYKKKIVKATGGIAEYFKKQEKTKKDKEITVESNPCTSKQLVEENENKIISSSTSCSNIGNEIEVLNEVAGFNTNNGDEVSDEIEVLNEAADFNARKEGACVGLQISMECGSVLSHYPFHRHVTSDFSLKLPFDISLSHNDAHTLLTAHSKECNGILASDSLCINGEYKNRICADIEHSTKLQKLLEIGNSVNPHESMRLEMLSHQQLVNRYRELREKIQSQKLSTLNLVRRNNSLMYQQSLNTRFRELIASADIPRLGTLLQVCHTKGMGIQSIIGRINDALNQKYKLKKYGEDEWDIAYLVLRIGGPKLLHILHTTHGLPAAKSTQAHSSKADTYVSAGVDVSFGDRIKNNSKQLNRQQNSVTTLKMDEIATESRLRWCGKDNKILGLCYQHAHNHNMSFNTMDDAIAIRDSVESGMIHKTKETLVVAVGIVENGAKIKSILTLPSCSKSESDQFITMINSICNQIEPDIIATDGDAMRRKVLNGRDKPIKNKDVRTVLETLTLLDLHIIDGLRALFFDDKHNAKRFCGVLISCTRGCMVGRNIISKSQLKYLFDAADIRNTHEILNPNDRQNVPAVLSLVDALNKCIVYHKNSEDQVCSELLNSLIILVEIFNGIICIFSCPKINLSEQLQKLSTLSHILYHQYREHGTSFIPGQLYHDLQRMVQASFFACALLRSRGGGKMYLNQLGTDQLEIDFNSVRTITHARNCDALELCQRLQHAEIINAIIAKHPGWKKFHGKCLGKYNDATSQVDWTGELKVDNINLKVLWVLGKKYACKVLDVDAEVFNAAPGSTMLRPNKRVGVTVDTEREVVLDEFHDAVQEGEDTIPTIPEQITEENEISLDIEEFLEENSPSFNSTVDVDGKLKHKSTIIRELFNETGSSIDRLRHVRTYSKFPSNNVSSDPSGDEIELDSMVMLGDHLCGKVMLQDGSSTLCIGKITSIKDMKDKSYKTVFPLARIADALFQVTVYHGNTTNGILILKDQKSTDQVTWKGSLSVVIDIHGMCIELEKAISILASLPVVDEKRIRLNCLPYDPSLQEHRSNISSNENEVVGHGFTCRICAVKEDEKLMRKHVGKHILADELENACGFCGLVGCTIDLITGSGRGKTATLTAGSNCPYKNKFSLKAAEKSTKTGPCTNRPVRCDICKAVYWSYNIQRHYKDRHSDYPIVNMVNDVEKKKMGLH